MIDVCHTHPLPLPLSLSSSLPATAPSCGSHRYQCQQVSRCVRIASLLQRPRILISSFCVQPVHPLLEHALSRDGAEGLGRVNHCYLDPLVAPSATLMLLLVFRIAIMLTIRRESPLWEITAMPPLLWGLIIRRSLLKNFLAD